MGSSEDPSLVNNVDELGLVYWGLNNGHLLVISHLAHFFISMNILVYLLLIKIYCLEISHF